MLLYKAEADRPKDGADLDRALPGLDASARRWLRDRLPDLHPGHGWLARL